MCPLINTPTPRGGDNHPTENIVSGGVVFDVDHDFEGPRAPKAHLDTVLTKPVTPPGQALYLSPDATHNETRFAPLATERGAEGRTEGQLLQLGALRTEGMNGELGRRLDGVCRAARAHLGRVRARVRARARVRVRVRVRVGVKVGVRVRVRVAVRVRVRARRPRGSLWGWACSSSSLSSSTAQYAP